MSVESREIIVLARDDQKYEIYRFRDGRTRRYYVAEHVGKMAYNTKSDTVYYYNKAAAAIDSYDFTRPKRIVKNIRNGVEDIFMDEERGNLYWISTTNLLYKANILWTTPDISFLAYLEYPARFSTIVLYGKHFLPLQKDSSLASRITLVSLNKTEGNCGFDHFYPRNS